MLVKHKLMLLKTQGNKKQQGPLRNANPCWQDDDVGNATGSSHVFPCSHERVGCYRVVPIIHAINCDIPN